MIIREYHSTRQDGVKLYRVYSDANLKIKQEQTGAIYGEAIDVENAIYSYVETDEQIDVPTPTANIKYSTLKIIRTLGDEWPTYRAMLEQTGVLDQFFAANYLSSDDPVFVAFIAQVPSETRQLLENCLWEE